jgi:hypothetical protein
VFNLLGSNMNNFFGNNSPNNFNDIGSLFNNINNLTNKFNGQNTGQQDDEDEKLDEDALRYLKLREEAIGNLSTFKYAQYIRFKSKNKQE